MQKKYESFDQSPAWQNAIQLTLAIAGLPDPGNNRSQLVMREELLRQALSLSARLAFAFEINGNTAKQRMLFSAAESAISLQSTLALLQQADTRNQAQFGRQKELATTCFRQIMSWNSKLNDQHDTPVKPASPPAASVKAAAPSAARPR
jgi:hypothetical protein